MPADKDVTASFTSEKFDVLDAISMDPRVTSSEFRVAYRLIQHANAETGAIFPSQERIASQVGLAEETVRKCIAGLARKEWMEVLRPNKRLPNMYRFSRKHVNAILDRQAMLNETRKEERKLRAVPAQGTTSPGAKSQKAVEKCDRDLDTAHDALTGTTIPVVTGTEIPVNTLRQHLNKSGIEKGSPEYAYAVASGRIDPNHDE